VDKIYILDASGYIYRSYFAIRQMTNDRGESTNALFGFIRSVIKLIRDFQPTHMVAVFDGPSNVQSRTALYADYKAHRKEMPKDLLPQILWAQQLCPLLGIPELMIPGVEADDTIASVAVWAAKQGATAYVCTSDKDLTQIVTDQILILNSFKENAILGPREVEEQYGVFPHQMIDFLAITGDASDNIPGLSGFGPKTAADLLKKFGTLDYILSHPMDIPGKKKQETLVAEKEKVLLGRRLVTIDTTIPFPKEISFFAIQTPFYERLREFYTYMNFSSLLREIEIHRKEEEKEVPQPHATKQTNYVLINDVDSLDALVAFLLTQTEICIDTETTDIHPLRAALVGIGLGVHPGTAWYIPCNGNMDKTLVLSKLKPLLENKAIGFYGHNLKYDLHVLKNHEIAIPHISFDTMLASYLLHSHSRQHSLDSLTLELFAKVKISFQELVGKGKNQLPLEKIAIEKVCEYCCEDVDYTMRLREFFVRKIEERGLHSLFYSLELPLLSVLAKMERNGIFVERSYLSDLLQQFEKQIYRLVEEIHQLADEKFNVNSPKQLASILFTKLGIRPPKKIASGFSTNAEVLESLKYEHPIAEKLLEYRSLEKLRSTYVEALLEDVHPRSNRIHCTFNQSVTATGRLSCQNPNLQNIPVRTPVGRQIREAFRPQLSNWNYLTADYSQIELRILAHLSEDPILMEAFLQNEDIHTFTASQIFNIHLEQVSKEQRTQAKTVNFGIMYGQQAFGLSQQLGINPKTAALFIEKYFERYEKVKKFIDASKEKAHQTGKAVTLRGRERLIPEITSSNVMIRSMAERLAVNTPIQGTQADLIKMAMLEIDRKLGERKLRTMMILQIHDELIFEVPDEELLEVKELVKNTMMTIFPLKVPLVVDIHIGKNWKECYI